MDGNGKGCKIPHASRIPTSPQRATCYGSCRVHIKFRFKAADIVEHSCDVDFLVGAQHKKGVRAQRKVQRIRAQRKVKSVLLYMAEHLAGEVVAAQLVEHFEPVRGNLVQMDTW